MTILFQYNHDHLEFEEIYQGINEIAKQSEYKVKKIKVTNKFSSRANYQVVVIIANEITEIKELKTALQNEFNFVILTSNINPDHVIYCIENAKSVFYLKKASQHLLEKIVRSSRYENKKRSS